MADATETSSSATEPAAELEAVAPATFAGWASLQRALNVTLPAQLKAAAQLGESAMKVLGG